MRENTILRKQLLAPKIYEVVVHAPMVVHNARPGQFVNVIVHEKGKTIPLTIADFDKTAGTLTLVFQAVGVSTMRMANHTEGDVLYSVRGPLGVASEIEKFPGKVVCVAGGVGIAPMNPVIRALKKAGNEIILIVGAREEQFLFWEEKISQYANLVYVCVEKPPRKAFRIEGLVTPIVNFLLTEKKRFPNISHVFGVGPLPMLRAISEITKTKDTKFVASAVSLMIDGTGMCFGCQYQSGGETFLLCRDGPEIDGNGIDWNMLSTRLNQFRVQEKIAMDEFQKGEEYAKYLAQETAFAGGSQ